MTASIPMSASDAPTDPHTALRVVASTGWVGTAMAILALSSVTTDDGWVGPYVVFATFVVIASVSTLWLAVSSTRPIQPSRARTVGRGVAIGLGMVAVAFTFVVPWAFAVWGVAQALTYVGLAATARDDARGVGWLAAVLVTGVVLALVGATAGIGAPGDDGDHGQVQGWALAVTAGAMALVVAWAPGWRMSGAKVAR